MKIQYFLTLAALTAAVALPAREPNIKLKETKIDRKGVKLNRKTWKVDFHHSALTFQNTITEDGKLSKKAWDDFMLGLAHGTINNGSWDGWNFIIVQSNNAKAGLPANEPAKKVDLVRYSDGASLNLSWNVGQLRIYQPANSAKWLYVKVNIPDGIRSVTLRVRPGGAHYNIKGRERMIRYNGNDYKSINKPSAPIAVAKDNGGMAFYSRNYNEKYGNLLIFEPEKTAKITYLYENPIQVTFHTKPGVKEMTFGLSYFANEDAEGAINRFLVEQLKTAEKAMESIQWDKAPDFAEFTRNAVQVKKLIAALPENSKEKAKFAKELTSIEAAYNTAKGKNDVSGYADALAQLRKLQKNVGNHAVNLLK